MTRSKRYLCVTWTSLLLCGAQAGQAIVPGNPPGVDPTDSVKNFTVYFDYDHYDINSSAQATLAGIKAFYDSKHVVRVEVLGHTDDSGTDPYNLELARRRAYAVRNYLKNLGCDKDLLIEIYGERRPVADNGEETGRKLNRRAEVKVYYRDPSLISYRLHGIVTDAGSGRPLIAEIALVGYRSDTAQLRTGPDGTYDLKLKDPRTMTITAFADGFLFQTRTVSSDTFDLGDHNEIAVNFMLRKIEKGLKFDLRNIYFEGNKAVILAESWPELLRLTKLMQDNPTLKIELRGHVNWPTTYPQTITFFAVNLSEERARTVYQFLLVNRISPDRLSYKGMANLEMIYPHTDQEVEMALNRRVEVVVVDY